MTDLSGDARAASMVADAQGAPKPSAKLLPTIAAVALLTAVAVAGGAAVGMLIGTADKAAAALPAPAAEPPAASAEAEALPTDAGSAAAPTILVKLEPIVTNIASPARMLLRVEASIVLDPQGVENPEVLAALIQSDTMTFLRTIDLAQIEGARGLLHLREDLRERARLRSPAVSDYLIQAMVAQ